MMALFALLGPLTAEGPVSEPEVRALVEAAALGDRAAARRLVRLYQGRVWRAVRPLCPGDADAEDLVQDTFVRALSSLGRYRPRPDARFVSWLLAIALNLARRRARRAARAGPLDAEVLARTPAPETDAPGRDLEAAERREALLAALARLGERDRQVVSLRYGADLSAAETARLVGTSEANVRKICERRRRELLEALSERLGEESR